VETLEFSSSERKLYDSIYIDVRKKFERLSAKGLVNKNYTSILAMLMRYDLPLLYPPALISSFLEPRLRRAVLHPHLVMTHEELEELENSSTSASEAVKLEDLVKHEAGGGAVPKTNAAFVEETLKSLGEEGEGRDECPLCLDMMETPVLIPPCMHTWCAELIV
jgi:DNA repair protein RAD5